MEWNTKEIKKAVGKAVFQKGFKSWLLLVAVCFIFSFVGSINSTAVTFIDIIDIKIGADAAVVQSNTELLKEFLIESSVFEQLSVPIRQLVEIGIDALLKDFSWLIQLLSANAAYFIRNSGEVAVYLLLAAGISAAFRFFVQNILVIGRHRFVMEHRYQKDTMLRRSLAPFHRKNLRHVIWVMFCYYLVIVLWGLTIVGGVYKYYQYRMIPYIMAENPAVPCKKAFALSKEMTHGYKGKIFRLELSLWYVWLVQFVPVAGLLLAVPYGAAAEAEIYFALRKRKSGFADATYLCEKAFDMPPLWEQEPAETVDKPQFQLSDILEEAFVNGVRKFPYRRSDLIFIFFTFSIIGWLWEVILHFIQMHELVNRGTMYGPWLPIYGAGAVLSILLLERFKGNVFQTFALVMVNAGVLEYAASWYLEFFCNACYWEYYDMMINLNGRICLMGLLLFGMGGTFAIYIGGPYICSQTQRLGRKQRYLICTALCVVFLLDLVCCAILGLNGGAGVGEIY